MKKDDFYNSTVNILLDIKNYVKEIKNVHDDIDFVKSMVESDTNEINNRLEELSSKIFNLESKRFDDTFSKPSMRSDEITELKRDFKLLLKYLKLEIKSRDRVITKIKKE